MNLYFDVDTRRFVSSPGTRDNLTQIEFKRGDTLPINVRFVSGLTIIELASGATGRLALKPLDDFDGEPVAGAASWVKTGTGTSTVYTFDLLLNTSALNTLLGVGEGDDLPSVTLNFEMEYIAAGKTISSNTLQATIFNDVNRDEDNTPEYLPDAEDWLGARAVRYDEAQALSDPEKAQAIENIGAETPSGAQAKASQALSDAKAFHPVLFADNGISYSGAAGFLTHQVNGDGDSLIYDTSAQTCASISFDSGGTVYQFNTGMLPELQVLVINGQTFTTFVDFGKLGYLTQLEFMSPVFEQGYTLGYLPLLSTVTISDTTFPVEGFVLSNFPSLTSLGLYDCAIPDFTGQEYGGLLHIQDGMNTACDLSGLTMTGGELFISLASLSSQLVLPSGLGAVAGITLQYFPTSFLPDLTGFDDELTLEFLTDTTPPDLSDIIFGSFTASDCYWTSPPSFGLIDNILRITGTPIGTPPDLADQVAMNTLDLSNCSLSAAPDIVDCAQLTSVDLSGNAIVSAATINALLVALDGFGLEFGSVDISGGTNAVPTGAGDTAATSLLSKSWSIITN